MKSFESHMLSLLIHGALIVYLIYAFVPPKAFEEGQDLIMEMMQMKSSSGENGQAAKVKQAETELLSKPVATTTRPSRKKPAAKIKDAIKAEKIKKAKPTNVVVQEESSWKRKIKEQVKNATQRTSEKKVVNVSPEPGHRGSQSNGEKPSPAAQSPVVGKLEKIASDRPGSNENIQEATNLKLKSGNIQPIYPALDRLKNREGTVVILAFISDQGTVDKMQLESNTGSYLMKTAAFDAFAKYAFEAGQSGWVRKSFKFKLKGPAKEFHAQKESLEKSANTESSNSDKKNP